MCPDSGRPWAFPVSGRECLIVDPSPKPQAEENERTSQSSQNITLGSFFGRPRSFKPREAGMAGMSHVDP
jgi:hypothetical protein